jgi:transposase
MGYSGAVSREHSSGPRVCRGAISEAGNAHMRRIVSEAAWAYRHRPAVGKTLAARQRRTTAPVAELAW